MKTALPLRESFISTGLRNAVTDGIEFRSWFVGDISDWGERWNAGLRQSTKVECKFDNLKAGDKRPGAWSCDSEKRTLTLLIRGSVLIRFKDEHGNISECRLAQEADYVIWSGVPHDWIAESDSTVITVRWYE
jgi:hypothetical protein